MVPIGEANRGSTSFHMVPPSAWFKIVPPGGEQGWPERVWARRTQNTDGGRGKQKRKKLASMPVNLSVILAFWG
jgi:hypothetical protein